MLVSKRGRWVSSSPIAAGEGLASLQDGQGVARSLAFDAGYDDPLDVVLPDDKNENDAGRQND